MISRSAASIWIIDNQNARRNINKMTRAYLTGRRYEEEKKVEGRPTGTTKDKKLRQSVGVNGTAEKIASQTNVSYRTVERAAKYAQAVDSICSSVGVHKQAKYIVIVGGGQPILACALTINY